MLTDLGREALRAWARETTPFTRIQSEAVVRLVAGDIVGDDAALRASLAALRRDLDEIESDLDEAEAIAETLRTGLATCFSSTASAGRSCRRTANGSTRPSASSGAPGERADPSRRSSRARVATYHLCVSTLALPEIQRPLKLGELLAASAKIYSGRRWTYVPLGAIQGAALVVSEWIPPRRLSRSTQSRSRSRSLWWSRLVAGDALADAARRALARSPVLAALALVVGVPFVLGSTQLLLLVFSALWLGLTSFAIPAAMVERARGWKLPGPAGVRAAPDDHARAREYWHAVGIAAALIVIYVLVGIVLAIAIGAPRASISGGRSPRRRCRSRPSSSSASASSTSSSAPVPATACTRLPGSPRRGGPAAPGVGARGGRGLAAGRLGRPARSAAAARRPRGRAGRDPAERRRRGLGRR